MRGLHLVNDCIGLIMDTDLLPVSELHFGDTGTPLDNKEGRFTLGPLRCVASSDSKMVTRGHGLHMGTSHLKSCPDIFFEFQLVSLDKNDVLYQLDDGQKICRLVIQNKKELVYSWAQGHMVAYIYTELRCYTRIFILGYNRSLNYQEFW